MANGLVGRPWWELEPAAGSCCPVVELRQYALHPGQREVLVELFDRALVAPQESVGMRLLGQFRDLDDPDRFVWLRGFPDMMSRTASLRAFYGGPDWLAHRDAANATMVAVDDVLLLRPAAPGSGFALAGHARPAPDADVASGRLVAAIVGRLEAPAPSERVAAAGNALREAVAAADGSLLAAFMVEDAPNTFPALPVREGEHACVWFVGLPDEAVRPAAGRERLHGWAATAADLVGAAGPPRVLRLEPTRGSLLRG
jgi:hypothetical protein